MSKFSRNLLKSAALVLGSSLLTGQNAFATPTQAVTENVSFRQDLLLAQAVSQAPATARIDIYNNKYLDAGIDQNPMSQVPSVNQLRDVEPTAWAYEALRSLVERYGCLVGYPARTYRGSRALSRWEFAAGLNACLNTIERSIQDGVAVLGEDMDKLKRLAREFESELATLGARVDNPEQRVAFLEDRQFSTTTQLTGEVIFSIADAFGDRAGQGDAIGSGSDETETVFQNRVRLNFETSFTGKDLLRVRLQAGNFVGNRFDANSPTGTNMTRLSYDVGGDSQVTVSQLFYRTSVGPVTLFVGADGVALDTVLDPINPLLNLGSTGVLSRLQLQNNIVYSGPANAGAAVTISNDFINFTVTYLSRQAADPREGAGLFNGDYSAGAQLSFNIENTFQIAATYVHSYQKGSPVFGGLSSLNTEFPFGNNPTSADRFGLQANFRPFPLLSLNAWGGYAKVRDENKSFDEQDVWSWNASATLVDVLLEGSLLWVGGGLPPKASSEEGTSYIIETGFRIPINDNIAITPGGYVILNPNHDGRNEPIYVGAIRTTFLF